MPTGGDIACNLGVVGLPRPNKDRLRTKGFPDNAHIVVRIKQTMGTFTQYSVVGTGHA